MEGGLMERARPWLDNLRNKPFGKWTVGEALTLLELACCADGLAELIRFEKGFHAGDVEQFRSYQEKVRGLPEKG